MEHELITAAAAASGPEVREHQPSRTVKGEDLLRRRDFERIAAQPVDPIVPNRHATTTAVLRVPCYWIPAPHDIRGEPA